MKKYIILVTGLFVISVVSLHAQYLASGDLGFMKGQKSFNIEYLYDGMTVGKMTEDAYTSKKVSEYNKKTPGKGDQWLASWKGDRMTRFQPRFEQMLMSMLSSKGVMFAPTVKDAKYTMVVKTTFTEPGFYAYAVSKNSSINLEITFYETGKKDKELAKVIEVKMPGRAFFGEDWDTGERIEEAYGNAGRSLGLFLINYL